jgi:hypothetical protein
MLAVPVQNSAQLKQNGGALIVISNGHKYSTRYVFRSGNPSRSEVLGTAATCLSTMKLIGRYLAPPATNTISLFANNPINVRHCQDCRYPVWMFSKKSVYCAEGFFFKLMYVTVRFVGIRFECSARNRFTVLKVFFLINVRHCQVCRYPVWMFSKKSVYCAEVFF